MDRRALSEPGVGRSLEGLVEFCCESDVGRAREENEDNHGMLRPEETGRGWLFVVADGMGGAAAGRTASDLAVQVTREEYVRFLKECGPSADLFDALRHAITRANAAIFERSRKDATCFGMGTTITALALRGDKVWTAHVGDSRIYRCRAGRLERLMRDHTRVQMLVDQGFITPTEANSHPEGHVISRNLGGRPDLEVDVPDDGPFTLQQGDVFMLCSDGLHGLVSDDGIRKILATAPPNEATPALIRMANRMGGYDNVTVTVLAAGRAPGQWGSFERASFDALLDEVALDVTSDTGVFSAIDPEGLSPRDFDTGALRAVQEADAPKPPAESPEAPKRRRGNSLQSTMVLDKPLTAALAAAAAAGQPNPSAPSPAPLDAAQATDLIPVTAASAPPPVASAPPHAAPYKAGQGKFPWALVAVLAVVVLLLALAAVLVATLLGKA